MTVVVGRRQLRSALGNVALTVFAPEPDPPEFRCRWEIAGPRTRRAEWAHGFDGWEALEQAMRNAATALRLGEEFAAGGRPGWFDQADPGLRRPDSPGGLGWRAESAPAGPVRLFRLGDAEDVSAMMRDLNAHEGYDPRDAPDPELLRREFDADARDSRGLIVVADGARGFATVLPTVDTIKGRRGGFLADLYVRPAHRRQGLGSALVRAAARVAGEREGAEFLRWTSLPGNAAARAFYAALGAEEEVLRAHTLEGRALRALLAEGGE